MNLSKLKCLMPLCILLSVMNLSAGQLETGSLIVMQDAEIFGELRLMSAVTVPTNGLELHYSFVSDESGIVSDLSGNARTGTVAGASWADSAVAGGCLYFDGNDDRVQIPKVFSDLFCGTNDFSISLWFYVDTGWSDGPFLFDMRGERGVYARGTADKEVDFAMDFGAFSTLTVAGCLSDEWYHWVGVYDADEGATMYLDGISVQSNNVYGAVDTASGLYNTIGTKNGGAGYELTGNVDEFRIYGRALSATDVTSIYRGDLSAGNSNPGRLVVGGTGRFEAGISYVSPLGDVEMGIYTNTP